jgi:excisionase family DNA binding protein
VDTLSTRQLAELLAVSEATVKRWADAEIIRCFRTPGGHRKFRVEDVTAFLRQYNYATPSGLGPPFNEAPPRTEGVTTNTSLLADQRSRLRAWLLSGDVEALLADLTPQRLSGRSLAELFDLVIAPAFEDIGDRWHRGVLTTAQEHIATATLIEVLARLRPLIETRHPPKGRVVLACAPEDQHDLALRVIALIAQSAGFTSTFIGARTPIVDLASLVAAEAPQVLVLSASEVTPQETLQHTFTTLAPICRAARTHWIIGGKGVEPLTPPEGVITVKNLRELQERLAELAASPSPTT